MKTTINCENFRGIAIADTPEKMKIAQLRCKQWSCDYCAKHNALQWRASLLDYINKNPSQWSFWTLTCPSWVRRGDKDLRYLTSLNLIQMNWDKFMKRAKRMLGKFEYLRVLETHKDGTIHIHLLAGVTLPDVRKVTRKNGSVYYYNAELKKHAVESGFGYIVDMRNLAEKQDDNETAWNAGGVAGYVTKYITKDLAKHDQQRKDLRVRKIQTSQGIKRVNLESVDKWELKSAVYLSEFLESEKPYHDVTTGHILTIGHFEGGVMYPPSKSLVDKDD